MSRLGKWITALLAVALCVLIGLNVFLRLSYRAVDSAMPDGGAMTLRREANGALLLSWPESVSAERYYLEILTLPDEGAEETMLYAADCERPESRIPDWLPQDQSLRIRVEPIRRFRFFGKDMYRVGAGSLSAVTVLSAPKTDQLSAEVDPNTASVRLSWDGWMGDRYRLYLEGTGDTPTLLLEPDQETAFLTFGTDALPIPAHGETVLLTLEPYRVSGVLRYYGARRAVALTRNDFLGSSLYLTAEQEGDNAYLLTWNETKSAGYQILAVEADGTTRALATYAADAERVYHTGHLAAYTDSTFRVVALDDPAQPDRTFGVEPDETTLRTGARLLYAAVWPLRDLDILSAPKSGEKLGVMKTDGAYCVTGEQDGWLQISTPFMSGYVDGNLCMINLPDYIGPLCSYDITNSYSSLYRVHEYDIPEVSGTVVSGYERVRMPDGSFLVPLLYPSAQKLISAAELAAAEGWRLKIYDSFRPNRATRSIYDLTEMILLEPLPEEDHNGRRTPEPAEDEDPPTYLQLMTNQTYSLGNFLASSSSRHNFGVALDLTIERIEDRREENMQTSMHDLSWYSATSSNNAAANLLRTFMTGGGFGVLYSEWWHFQDNDAYAAYRLSGRWTGVDPKGWQLDDVGWRYRTADGRYLTDAETEIDGTPCSFDAYGYLIETT